MKFMLADVWLDRFKPFSGEIAWCSVDLATQQTSSIQSFHFERNVSINCKNFINELLCYDNVTNPNKLFLIEKDSKRKRTCLPLLYWISELVEERRQLSAAGRGIIFESESDDEEDFYFRLSELKSSMKFIGLDRTLCKLKLDLVKSDSLGSCELHAAWSKGGAEVCPKNVILPLKLTFERYLFLNNAQLLNQESLFNFMLLSGFGGSYIDYLQKRYIDRPHFPSPTPVSDQPQATSSNGNSARH